MGWGVVGYGGWEKQTEKFKEVGLGRNRHRRGKKPTVPGVFQGRHPW